MNNALAFKLVMSSCREGRFIKDYIESWPAQFYFQCQRKENSFMTHSLDSCHDFTSGPSVNCSPFPVNKLNISGDLVTEWTPEPTIVQHIEIEERL
jgi:hypothetical protein